METTKHSVPFGDVLARYRKAAGLTQEELAERARLSRNAISALERGSRQSPRRDTVVLLAAALELADEDRSQLLVAARRHRQFADVTPPPPPVELVGNRPVPSPPQLPPSNLPHPPTPLIGREQEVSQATALLARDEVRLLTLTGVGGVGKTRLAIEVASLLRSAFSSGVFFVSLAAVTEAELVADTVAAVLGVREQANVPFSSTLSAFLAERTALLVLDNFEQVLGAAPLLSELLAACPQLKVLVTSRAPLQLRGEQVFPVPLLAVPKEWSRRRGGGITELAKVSSVALFIQRAQAAQHDFRLTSENATTIAAICQRLEGVPLALELAAPWVSLLPPAALLARLDGPLALLVGDGFDLPERQQTLRRTIQWSYELLSEEEQVLFRLLTVFAEGCSLEAVESVASEFAGSLLRLLRTLVQKNMVTADLWALSPRVAMLETLREYGLEQLKERGEEAATSLAHAWYYLRLAEQAESELRGPKQEAWLARLELEHANLRSALHWTLMQHEGELALRLGAALWRFWYLHAYFGEGRRWLEHVLAEAEADDPLATSQARSRPRASVLAGAGILACLQGDYLRAAMLLDRSIEIARRLDDRWLLAATLNDRGHVAHDQGDNRRATELFEEGLALYRSLDDSWGTAVVLGNLGSIYQEQGRYGRGVGMYAESLTLFRQVGDRSYVASVNISLGILLGLQGSYQRATEFCREGLELYRDIDDPWGEAASLQNLGILTFWQGGKSRQAKVLLEASLKRFRRLGDALNTGVSLEGLGNIASDGCSVKDARALLEESLAIFRRIGSRRGVAGVLASLGDLWRAERELAQAAHYYEESLAVYHSLGASPGIARCLVGIAAIAEAQQQSAFAAQLLGAADHLRDTLGMPRHPVERPPQRELLDQLRTKLGQAGFESARRTGADDVLGQVMLTGAVSAEEQPDAAAPASSAPPAKEGAPMYPDDLTAREVEVLHLLAQGWSDAQIAQHLVISPRTVNRHTTSIYSKIGVSSRSAATRYAMEHQLA
ncbi:MAG: tetratricopeptide repeat protein [Ktedonobacterales bacterium]